MSKSRNGTPEASLTLDDAIVRMWLRPGLWLLPSDDSMVTETEHVEGSRCGLIKCTSTLFIWRN